MSHPTPVEVIKADQLTARIYANRSDLNASN